MPPEPVVHTSKTASFVRGLSILLVGILLGVAVALVGGYYVLVSPAGEPIVRNYFVPRPSASLPAAQSQPAATSSVQASIASTTILVPKAYANEAYYVAINRVVNDVNELNANNAALAPVLDTLNTQTLSCDFRNFYENMTAARNLVQQNQEYITQFSSDLSALDAANAATTDAATKGFTADAITAGQAFQVQFQSYNSTLSQILRGDVPTSAQTAALSAQVTATHDASAAFSAKLQIVLQHFAEAVQNAVQTGQ